MRRCFTKGKFNRVVPMTVQVDACKSMAEFNTHDVGIPENLVTDGTGEFTRKDAKFVKGSETNANEDATTERSRKGIRIVQPCEMLDSSLRAKS